MRARTLLLAAIVVASPGCAVKALYKAITKSKYETVVTGSEQRPLELTRGVRSPRGVYFIEARYTDGSLKTVVFDPKALGALKRWPRAVPRDPVQRPLPDLDWGKRFPGLRGGTPLSLVPCAKAPAKAFPCAQLRGRELWLCQGPGKPVPVARFRVWTPTRRRRAGSDLARKIGLGFLFPLAIAADAAVVVGYAGLIWFGAGAPGLGCF